MIENKVSIHQPNFFPWLGYFHKIIHSDYFVILDHVQFPKKGSCWGNRVKLIMNYEVNWATVPLKRVKSLENFNEIQFDENRFWRKKFVQTLRMNYAKSPYFKIVIDKVIEILEFDSSNLSAFNSNAIMTLLDFLEVPSNPKIIFSSTLNCSGKATELLISIVKELNGTQYISGMGAESYQEEFLYAENNIDLVFQNFFHPTYKQINTNYFQPGLSILDPLFNLGPKKTLELIL